MIQDFKTYIGEGTLWGNTILRSDTDKVRKEDEITEDFVRSFIYNEKWNGYCRNITIRKENNKPIVDVDGSFRFKEDITEIPFQFGRVTGGFYLFHCENLISLKGSPKEVAGIFCCAQCKELTSLEGCPEKVGSFDCSNCDNIISLEGCPKEVCDYFDCADCGKRFRNFEVRKNSSVKGNIIV